MFERLYVRSWLSFAMLAAPAAPLFAALQSAQSHASQSHASLANMDFECGESGGWIQGWAGSFGPDAKHYWAVLDRENPRSGKASLRLERAREDAAPGAFGVVMKSIDAAPYRGKRVRFGAAVRVREEPSSKVGLWLRVDGPDGKPSFFEDMRHRPIRSAEWSEQAIEAEIPADAKGIAFGLLVSGGGAAWIDDARLDVVGAGGSAAPAASAAALGCPASSAAQRARTAALQLEPAPRRERAEGDEPPRPLTELELGNLKAFARLYGYLRFFHPSDEAAAADWDSLAIAGVQRAGAAKGPRQLAAELNRIFRPIAPTFSAYVSGSAPALHPALRSRPESAKEALRWRHASFGDGTTDSYKSQREAIPEVGADGTLTIDLAGGVSAIVPIAAWRDAEGKTLPKGTAPVAPDKPARFIPAAFDRTTRLAAAVSAWNVFQHFYPYFDVVEVDWAAELDRALHSAATDADPATFHRSLRRLVAALDDGHGGVRYDEGPIGTLPLAWQWIEDKLVVTGAGAEAQGVKRGDVVTHIAGAPAAEAMQAAAALTSGSPQWVRWRAAQELLSGPAGKLVEVRLVSPSGEVRALELAYKQHPFGQQVREARPGKIAEIRPGIVYVDLDRASEEEMRAGEKSMLAAKALIFDLRGYPKGSPWYLNRLTDRRIQSARMEVPVHLKPDRRDVTYSGGAWSIVPQAPRFTRNIAFITDGSAISYAESVLGTIKGNRLAEIVGAPTAGANGNITTFRLPGGYRIVWTGMRVTNQDGSQHHLVGVAPTIPAARTVAGVQAGRDELLEKALQVVEGRMTTQGTQAPNE